LVLVDQNVAQHWGLISGAGEGPTQVKSAAGMPLVPYEWDQTCSILTIVSGEQNKTLETAVRIVKAWRQHLESQKDRDSAPYLFVIGGGLLGDIAAFAAGLVGAPVTLVPTTLLAMVDACVGGKTGVNFNPFGKNQVGLFYFPQEVNVWSGWLKTLPIREWRSGIMECLKHALLVSSGPGQPLFVKIEEIINTYSLAEVNDSLLDIIKVKSDVVGKDPGEKGERAILNFGHTLGHALEAKSHLKAERTANPFSPHLLHGEAVGLGMLFALELSQIVCGLVKSEANYLNRLIKKGLSFGRELKSADILAMLGATSWDDPDLWSDLVQMMSGDKKNQGMSIHWVLIRGIGQPFQPQPDQWTTAVDLTTMKKAWEQFLLDLRQL
jgi:3-dehydroquinate synthase